MSSLSLPEHSWVLFEINEPSSTWSQLAVCGQAQLADGWERGQAVALVAVPRQCCVPRGGRHRALPTSALSWRDTQTHTPSLP